MTLKNVRFFKKAVIVLGAGILFGGLSCVTAADLLGTGLNVAAATGVLGDASQGVGNVGTGLNVIADLVKYTPIGG